MIEMLKQRHIRVLEGNNDIDEGISKLKSYFKNGVISVDFGCKNLIKELQSYRYEKDRITKNKTERPVKKFDHACDALRYGVTNFNPFRKPVLPIGGRFR
jgi:phage terminase large subunit